MGYLVTHGGDLQQPELFALLAAASCLFYLSGMVLNDVFDAEIDAGDRPDRPIPSGRVARKSAFIVGTAMWAIGLVLAWQAAFFTADWRPALLAHLLVVCIILYDKILKRTPVAPLAMGSCRTLNVLFGMSLSYSTTPGAHGPLRIPLQWTLHEWLIALGVGSYVVGVTIFARTEARASARSRLIAGLVVLLSGIVLLTFIPLFTQYEPPIEVSTNGWFLLWTVVALLIGRRCVTAITKPAPQNVQAAVRNCVHSIIVLDAAVCVGYASPFWAFAVLALLFPTMLLTLLLSAT